jgi:hypothetical protein
MIADVSTGSREATKFNPWRWSGIKFGLACLAAWLSWCASGPALAQRNTEPLVIQLSKSATRETRPGLVVLILDHSRSMGGNEGVPAAYGGKTRWQASLADAVSRIDNALANEPGEVDLRAYGFASKPAEYDHYRPLPRLTRRDGSGSVKVALGRMGEPNGETALYISVRNIAQGLLRDNALAAYGWVWVVLYSDGDDSQNSEKEKAAMCSALSELSHNPRVCIDYLPIGNAVNALDANCGGLRRTGLGQIQAPVVYRLNSEPNPLRLAGGKAGGNLETRIQWKGIASTADARFDLQGAPAGLSVLKDPNEDRLTWKLPDTLSDGAGFQMVISVPLPDSPNRISVSNEVIIPPLAMPPTISGLPEACAENGGKRTLVKGRGEIVQISPILPADAEVSWRISPGGGAQSGPVFREGSLAPGAYEVRITASRPGSKEISDTVVVHVVETHVDIVPAGGAKEVLAGDDFPVSARPQLAGLPDFMRGRMEAVADAWRVGGQRQRSKGLSLTAKFSESGRLAVDFIAPVETCHGSVCFLGSTTFEVKPGISVRVATDRIIQGLAQSVLVEVSDRDLVDHVLVSIDKGGTWVQTHYKGSERRNVLAETPLIALKAIDSAKVGNKLTVWARPVRKRADGTITDPSDPENIKRQRVAEVELVPPEIELTVKGMSADAEVAYGRPVPLEIVVSGHEGDLVKEVEVRIKSGAAPCKLGGMAKGDKAPDGFVSLWRSDVLKPDEKMGRDLELEFVALDGSRSLARKTITVHPMAPRPILVTDKAGLITWSGGPENVPTVVVKLVESGSKEPYPDALVQSVTWKASGAIELASPPGERSQMVSLRPVRKGQALVEVVMRGPSGEQTANLPIKVDPAPLTAENAPQLRVVKAGSPGTRFGRGSDFWVRGSATLDLASEGKPGAYQSRTIELVRGKEKTVLPSEQGIAFPGLKASWSSTLALGEFWRKPRPTPCAVRVTWVPWGESKDAATSKVAEFDAVAGPSWLQGLALGLAALGLVFLAWQMGVNNENLGKTVQWQKEDGKGIGRVSKMTPFNSRSRYSLFSKRVTIKLPLRPGGAEYDWLADSEIKKDRLSLKGAKLNPTSDHGKLQVEKEDGTLSGVRPKHLDGSHSPVNLFMSLSSTNGQGLRSAAVLSAVVAMLLLLGMTIYLIWAHPWPTS